MVHIAYKSASQKSKWIKTKWLERSNELKYYVPTTKLFSKSELNFMLNKYNTVFFKPVDGTGGAKIVKITKKDGNYIKQYNASKTSFSTLDDLYSHLIKFAGKRTFILQKGITLAKTSGKPFDIRVMVQKNKINKWVVTAIFSKVGQRGKVATNYHQGGYLQSLNKTLTNAGYTEEQKKQTEDKLTQLGYTVARVFSKKNKNYKELGLDVALDSNRAPHILEVNTRPNFYPLKHFKDKSMYNRIVNYAKQYGRVK